MKLNKTTKFNLQHIVLMNKQDTEKKVDGKNNQKLTIKRILKKEVGSKTNNKRKRIGLRGKKVREIVICRTKTEKYPKRMIIRVLMKKKT